MEPIEDLNSQLLVMEELSGTVFNSPFKPLRQVIAPAEDSPKFGPILITVVHCGLILVSATASEIEMQPQLHGSAVDSSPGDPSETGVQEVPDRFGELWVIRQIEEIRPEH